MNISQETAHAMMQAIDAMLTGIDIHNKGVEHGNAGGRPIKGPVVEALKEAYYKARDEITPKTHAEMWGVWTKPGSGPEMSSVEPAPEKTTGENDVDWVIRNALNNQMIVAKRQIGTGRTNWEWHWTKSFNSASVFTKAEALELVLIISGRGIVISTRIERSQEAYRIIMGRDVVKLETDTAPKRDLLVGQVDRSIKVLREVLESDGPYETIGEIAKRAAERIKELTAENRTMHWQVKAAESEHSALESLKSGKPIVTANQKPMVEQPSPAKGPTLKGELAEVIDNRVIELAERMQAPGGKCDQLSMSEIHEVAEAIFAARAIIYDPRYHQESPRIDDRSKTAPQDPLPEIVRLRDSLAKAEGKVAKYANLLAQIYCHLTDDVPPEAIPEDCYAHGLDILRKGVFIGLKSKQGQDPEAVLVINDDAMAGQSLDGLTTTGETAGHALKAMVGKLAEHFQPSRSRDRVTKYAALLAQVHNWVTGQSETPIEVLGDGDYAVAVKTLVDGIFIRIDGSVPNSNHVTATVEAPDKNLSGIYDSGNTREEALNNVVSKLAEQCGVIQLKSTDLTFNKLTQANKDRQPSFRVLNMEHLILALCGEAGELAQEAKRFYSGEESSTVETMIKEAADVVIYADLIASAVGRRLGDVVTAKFNETSDWVGSSVKI